MIKEFTHSLSVRQPDGHKAHLEVKVDLEGLDLVPLAERGLRDFLANEAKVVRDGKVNPDDWLAGIQSAVERYCRGERKRSAGPSARALSPEEKAIALLLGEKARTSKSPEEIQAAGLPEVPYRDGRLMWEKWGKLVVLNHPDHVWVKKVRKFLEASI